MRKHLFLLLAVIAWLGVMQDALSCRTEVVATNFGPAAGAPSPYYNISNTDIREWKEDDNDIIATLTPKVGYAASQAQVGTAGGGYGAVRMPSDVNTGWGGTSSTNKSMIIFPFGTTNYADLLSFKITGLKPNEPYTIVIDAVLVARGTGCPNGNNGTFNLFGFRNDINNARTNPPTFSAQSVSNGQTQTLTVEAQSNAGGELLFSLLSGTSTNAGCIATMGFTSIKVTGCPIHMTEEPGEPDPCPMLTNTPPNPCEVASATIFESTDWENDIHDISTVKFIGTEGIITTPLNKGTKTTIGRTGATGKVYGVVDNPYKVNTLFPNIKKPMIILPHKNSNVAAMEELFRYSVSGLNPSKEYEIVVEAYFMTAGCTNGTFIQGEPTLEVNFGKDNNGNSIRSGPLVSTGYTVPNRPNPGDNPVVCFTATRKIHTGTELNGVTAFDMVFTTNYGGYGATCTHIALGITSVTIRGTSAAPAAPALIPKIHSSQGAEVCRNELIRFSLDRKYEACTYKWEKAPASTGPWKEVGHSQNYLELITESAYYRCTINEGKTGGYGVSSIIHVNVIDCCNEADGGSRVTLLHDDFGYFPSRALYVTTDGRTIPTCNGLRRVIMDPAPAVRPAYGTPNMPGVVFLSGCTYQASNCEVRNPGDVAICAVPDMNGWYHVNQVGMADADGNSNGGVLFLDAANCMETNGGEVYRRLITGLCEGKRTYSQVDFAPGSDGSVTQDVISLNIYANNNGSKGVKLASTGELKNFKTGWQTFKFEFDLPANTSSVFLTVEYVRFIAKSSGEFFMDNVKFMVCSQPHIDAYSNIETLAQDTTICGDAMLKFGTKLNDKIKNAYNNQVRFIYQRSTDNKNWENITGIIPDESINLDMSKYPGTQNYFRVVAAEAKDLQKFLTDPDAEIYANACRTTSISLPFMVFREGNMNMGADEVFSECKGRELTLTGTPALSEPQIAQWEWVTASGTVLVPKGSDPLKRDIKYTVNGSEIVYFVGYNKNGCSARKKFTINESAKVTITLSEVKVCGKTTINATSVPATGVTYAWTYTNGANITATGPSIALDLPNYQNGTVTVTGTTTAPGYCASDVVTRSIIINAKPSTPTATTPLSYPVEAGNANVSTDANVQSAAGNTLYWRNGAGTLLLPPVLQSKSAAGTFTFWVGQISPEGCRSDSVQITVIISTVPAPDVRNTSICEGESIDFSTLAETNEPGGTLVWYANTTGGALPAAPVLNNPAPADYTYYVTQKIGDDESERTPVKVTVIELPKVNILNNTGTTQLTCTNPSIRLTATGGGNTGTYSWDGGLGNSADANVTAPGDYTVTVTTNGCQATKKISITLDKEVPEAGINNPVTTVLTCTTPSIVLTATGNGSYSWSNDLGNTASVTVTLPGNYTVTVTAANGCTDTESILITEDKTAPEAGIINNTNATVLTCTTPSISLTATGNGTYAWSNGLGNNATVTVTEEGNYRVTVTAANGCTGIRSIEIWEDKDAPEVEIANYTETTVLTCNDPSILLEASGGASYLWDNGLGANANVTVSIPGDYTVTVTGRNGCESTESITITEDIALPPAGITNNSITTVLTCLAPSISLTATGGGTYSWDNGLGNNANVTVGSPGTYTVTVTAANGCQATANITITADGSMPVADIINNTETTILTCNTTSISLTASGGASYLWDNGLGNSANASVTSAGTYTVTVTATNGCTAFKSITITENKATPIVVINSETTVLTCTVPTVTLTATGGVSYSWDNDLGNNATAVVTAAGTYTVTVTADNGCTATKSITITADSSIPTAGITTNTGTTLLTCATPNITLTASGGDKFVWSNDLGVNAIITVNKAGTYTVTVTSSNGCTAVGSIDITSNQSQPTINVNNAEICLGNQATLTASGANTYTWTPSADLSATTGSNVTASPAATTTYTVEGTVAATGCKNIATATVYVETPIQLTLNAPKSVELGNEITITVIPERTDHGNFEWFVNNESYRTTAADEKSITFQPGAGKQHYSVTTATAKLNCPSSSEGVSVTVTESVPNAINPYSPSGRNCCFMRGYTVEIYNCYMQKVFEGGDGWDGTYRGAPVDPGTYFYRLYKKDGEVEKGTLEVVKF